MASELILPAPSPKQRQFLTDTHKYICFGGARGGGKSYGIDIGVCAKAFNYPGITQTIVRKTYPELYENHILKLKDMLQIGNGKFARYNDQRKEIVCVNGSRIVFKYCDTMKDLEHFQGLQTDLLYLDEATQHPEEVWTKFKAIVRGTNGYPKRIYLTCNPGGQGMAWVKRLFIDRVYNEKENPEDYSFIQSLVTDNLALMKAQPDYLEQLESLPPRLRAAWLEGDWNTLEGQFFEDFRIDPDMKAAVDAGFDLSSEELRAQRRFCHVIEPFDLSKGQYRNWTVFRSYDFGYSKPYSMAWWAVDYDGVMYRIMEDYGCTETPNEGTKLNPDQQAERIAEIERTHPWLRGREIHGFADPAIWDSSRGEAIIESFYRHGIYMSKGDNARVPGWQQCHYRLQFDKEGYARMYVFSNCRDFIRTVPMMMYDEHRPEDMDTKLEDHISDEWRYACMSRPITPLKPVKPKQRFFDPLDQLKR